MSNSQFFYQKAILGLFSFIFFSISTLNGQENGDNAFAFVLNKNSSTWNFRSRTLIESNHPKYLTAYTVYQTLVNARGDMRLPAPDFVMSKNETYVAWMDANKVLIGLEEKSYDVCMGFGADSLNALAALLAHEITHYYEKHDWSRHFISENNPSDLGKKIQSIEEGIKHEAQADYLGGFLAVSSGFQVAGIMPRLLDSLYKAYLLPDTLAGYPSLEDRKAMSISTQNKLVELQYAFEMSNFLTVLGCYEAAEQYQHFLLHEFQSREIYNNAGVLTILSAFKAQDNGAFDYFYPFELDPQTRLSNRRKGGRLKSAPLLQKSVEYFTKAKELDPTYTPAYLNLACVYAIINEIDDAQYFLKKAEKLLKNQNDDKIQGDIWVVKGILSCLEGDTLAALNLFEKAQKIGNELGRLNRDKLKNSTKNTNIINVQKALTSLEIIDSMSLDRFLVDLNVAQVLDITKGKSTLGIKKLNNSIIYVHLSDYDQQTIVVQAIDLENNVKTSQNVGRGTKQTEVLDKYKTPSKTIETKNGQYWIYYSEQIGFLFDENNEVFSWFTFRIK
jgi:tetratricopeptide (TPR) repeat protein